MLHGCAAVFLTPSCTYICAGVVIQCYQFSRSHKKEELISKATRLLLRGLAVISFRFRVCLRVIIILCICVILCLCIFGIVPRDRNRNCRRHCGRRRTDADRVPLLCDDAMGERN